MSDCKYPQNNPKSHHIPSLLLHRNQTRNFLSKLIPNGRSRECTKKKEKKTATEHIKWGNSYEPNYDVTLSSKEISDIVQDETGKFRAHIPKRKLTFGKEKKNRSKRGEKEDNKVLPQWRRAAAASLGGEQRTHGAGGERALQKV